MFQPLIVLDRQHAGSSITSRDVMREMPERYVDSQIVRGAGVSSEIFPHEDISSNAQDCGNTACHCRSYPLTDFNTV